MSDTPRTDAIAHNVPELAMFARALEREFVSLMEALAVSESHLRAQTDSSRLLAADIEHLNELLRRRGPLVPAEEAEKAYREGFRDRNALRNDLFEADAYRHSRARRVVEGEEL